MLHRDGDRWTASGCGGIWLADELSAPGTLAAPTGSGEVALIAAGRTGPAMLASFDVFGNLTAWGLGESADELSNMRLCPGSTTFVGTTWRGSEQSPMTHVVRRDVATLSTIDSVVLPERAPDAWPITDARDVECTSPEGDVALLVSASGFGGPANSIDNVVVWIDGDSVAMHRIEHGWGLAAAPDGTSGFLISGEYGTSVERIALADGTRQPFADLSGLGGHELAVDGETGRIAVVATSKPEPDPDGDVAPADDRLVVLDAGGGLLANAVLPEGRIAQSVDWFDRDHVVVVWAFPIPTVEVIALDGTIQSSVDVASESVAVFGDLLFVATEDGVESMTIDGDDRRLLTPSIARVRALVAVPCGPVAAPQPTESALRATPGFTGRVDLPASC